MDPTGKFELFFNAELAGPAFMDELNKGLSTEGRNSGITWEEEEENRDKLDKIMDEIFNRKKRNLRGLSASSGGFELSNFMTFELYRGGEDSATNEELGYEVVSTGIKDNKLGFKFTFDQPL